MLKCVVAKQRLTAPTSGLWVCLWVPKDVLWVSLGVAKLGPQISWVASVQRDSKGVSVLVSEAAIDGMWDPLLLWQTPVYSRYLLCLLGNSHPSALEHSLSSGLWPLGGLIGSVPPLCLALSEQFQVEPCLSQTVENTVPSTSLSDSCDVHRSFFGP